MATLSGQGNTNEQYQYAANSLINVDVYCPQDPPVVGSYLYADITFTTLMPAGWYRFDHATDNHVIYTVNSAGQVTASSRCSWSSAYTEYTDAFSGTRNNCPAGSSPGSISVASGTVKGIANAGQFISYTSQADANAQAATYAQNSFNSQKQTYINNNTSCIWTSTKSGSCSGTYTKSDCSAGCYGTSVTYTGTATVTRTSTVSQADADNIAQIDANSAACAVRDTNGPTYANNNGSCCCWVYEEYCSGCQRRSRERNTCDGSYRNDALVANNSCSCGTTCAGTTWGTPYCNGTTTKYRDLVYVCNGSYAGTTETLETCSSYCGTDTQSYYTYQNYLTCYGCYCRPVYRDTNTCSPNKDKWYIDVNGTKIVSPIDNGYGQPTGGCSSEGTYCGGGSNCVDSGSPYCSNGNWVVNRVQGNPCSGEPCASPRVIEYNSTANGCYTPSYTVNIYAKRTGTLGSAYVFYGVNNSSTSQGGGLLNISGGLFYSFTVTHGSTVYVETKDSNGYAYNLTSNCISTEGYCSPFYSCGSSFTVTGNLNIFVTTDNSLCQ